MLSESQAGRSGAVSHYFLGSCEVARAFLRGEDNNVSVSVVLGLENGMEIRACIVISVSRCMSSVSPDPLCFSVMSGSVVRVYIYIYSLRLKCAACP